MPRKMSLMNRRLYMKVMAVAIQMRIICPMLPASVMLVMTKPLLKNAANGGNPLVVIIIMTAKAKVTGMAFRKPPIKRMSLVPRAWMMPPAKRKPSPSKKAWLIMWNRLENQPSEAAAVIAETEPNAAIMKPSWLTVE